MTTRFCTMTYNSELNLRRAIESVINQAHGDWIYYLYDDGSTDGTREIIKEYTNKDSRIVPVYIDTNDFSKTFHELIKDTINGSDDYFCWLDANDEYSPDFLEKSLTLLKECDTDIVACISDYIDVQTNSSGGGHQRSSLYNNTIIEGEDFGIYFPIYHQFTQTIGGKVFKVSLLKQCNFANYEEPFKVIYGADTLFCLKAFSISKSIGVVAKSLHKYDASSKASYKPNDKIAISNRMLHDKTLEFLVNKVGVITSRNENFLNLFYLDAIKNILNIMSDSQISEVEKIEFDKHIYNIIEKYPLLTEMTAQSAIFLSDAVFAVINDDLQTALDKVFQLSYSEIPIEYAESYLIFSQYICAATEYTEGWIFFKKLWAQFLWNNKRFDEANIEIDELIEMLPNDKEIQEMDRNQTFFIKKINYQKNDNNHNKITHSLLEKTTNEAYTALNELTDMLSHNKKTQSTNISYTPSTDKVDNPKYTNSCDQDFYDLIEKIKNIPTETLLEEAAKSANEWISVDEDYYNSLLKWYNSWYGVKDFNIKEQGFVRYFGSMYNYLKQNTDNLVWLYENLCNYRSKYQLKIVLQHWLNFNPDIRKYGIEKTFEHYYDLDIIKCDENEVFVDCGTYNGDTIVSFINHYSGRYKSIYGYELTPATYDIAVENLKKYDRVFLRNAGVAHENGTMQFNDSIGAGNRLGTGGNAVGQIVKLDDDIKEEVTFIKMDIEGAEMAALTGAAEHIKRSKPKLAISLYHKLSDLIDIPKLIRQLVPEYKFYFQHYPSDFPFPTEYVLLAVCEDENTPQEKAKLESVADNNLKPVHINSLNNSSAPKPANYRSCNMINQLFLNFYLRIDQDLNCLTMCCEGLSDKPSIPFGNTAKESVENFIKMQKAIITESIKDVSADERVFSKGCLNCTNYQLGKWQENNLIHYINFSMYPAPCQCKCFYCDIRKDGMLDFTNNLEVKKSYRHMFDMLKYARENGLIAPTATYQVSSGEITIHPYKNEILEFTKNQATVFYTNCFIFDEQISQNLASNPRSCINLSIDAGTSDTWHKVKGVNNFNKVIENLEKYHSRSIRKGQITLKYIIFPEVNDEDEDFFSVVDLMKRFDVQSLDLGRDIRVKYSQTDEDNEKLIQSAARLATILYKQNLIFGMFSFKPIERKKIIDQVAKNINLGL